MGLFDSIAKAFKKGEVKEPFKKEEVKESFTKDKAEWQYHSCLEEYCKLNNKKENEITEKEQEFIWECSGLLISYFLTWLINNNYINAEEADISEDAINAVKERKIKTTEFFGRELDYTLTKEDISENIIGFVDDYYNNVFYKDYPEYMEKVSGKNLFCCEFSWKDYDNIEKIIDNAYTKYKNK